MIKRIGTAAALVIILWGWLGTPAARAVELRFDPPDQNIDLAAAGSLSIWLDEALEVRTIEVTVAFTGSVLTSVAGTAGSAFQDLPCYVWEDYQSEENQWYGFAVAIGADCFVVGPGELYRWDFVGGGNGTAEITAVAVGLYDRLGVEVETVELPGTTVVVGDGVVPASGPAGPGGPTITATPNPFNPLTNIRFWLPEARSVQLDVFDLRGRRIIRLLDGPVDSQWTEVRWNGRTESGTAAPSGVYLYLLETGYEHLTGRLVLAR